MKTLSSRPCTEVFVSTVKEQFFQDKQVWQTKMGAFPNITHTDTLQAAAKTINQLRRSLDDLGNTVLLHHALDTNSIGADSVLVWLGHLDSYDADLQLARHHFFTGNYALADTLLADIPVKYDIGGELLDEFEDIVAILAAIQPTLEDTIDLHQLPENLIDTLANTWGTDCSDAGALARDLLYRNGLRYFAVCDSVEERPSFATLSYSEPLSSSIRVFPNPANRLVTLERSGLLSELHISFVHISSGRVCFERTMLQGESSKVIDVSSLTSGIYAIIYRSSNEAGQVKMVISH